MKKLVILLLSFLIVTACSDDFLDTVNKNNLDNTSFLKNEKELTYAINAAYTPFAYLGVFGLNYYKIFNSLDSYIWFEGQSGFDIMNFSPTNADLQEMYLDFYYVLFRTSDILSKMTPLKDKIEENKYKQYQAQLKALRGLSYFYLVTLFDTPVYYDETNVPTDALKSYRNGTREQFWTKLEEDLDFAIANLPASWPNQDLGRITSGGASAILGKALLYKHYHYYLRFDKANTDEAKANIEKAKSVLNNIIKSGNYSLSRPAIKTKEHYQAALLCNFSFVDIPVGSTIYKAENNQESVYEIQYNDNPGTNTYLPAYLMGGNMLSLYFSTHQNGYRNMVIDPSLWNTFESVSSHPAGYAKDPRAYATCYLDGDMMDWRPESGYAKPFDGTVNAKGGIFPTVYSGFTLSKAIGIKKYFYPTYNHGSAPAASPVNFRVIRYSDVLLMYAEACFQSGSDLDEGLKALNEVRARVDMPPVSELTPSAIMHERDVELATEGHRYNDIIRWSYDSRFNINFATMVSDKFNIKRHLYFPIPQYEIDANKGALKQNAGW